MRSWSRQQKWHFFATSQVKSACDGIGGTVKTDATKKSLQTTTAGHIVTPIKLYSLATQNIVGIHFVYCTSDWGLNRTCWSHLKHRLDSSQTMNGTHDNHCFITVDKYTVSQPSVWWWTFICSQCQLSGITGSWDATISLFSDWSICSLSVWQYLVVRLHHGSWWARWCSDDIPSSTWTCNKIPLAMLWRCMLGTKSTSLPTLIYAQRWEEITLLNAMLVKLVAQISGTDCR